MQPLKRLQGQHLPLWLEGWAWPWSQLQAESLFLALLEAGALGAPLG